MCTFWRNEPKACPNSFTPPTAVLTKRPQIEGFRRFYGVNAHTCPCCDGWEHRDQPLAAVGGNKEAADLALELLLWSKDVLLCANDLPECDSAVLDQIESNGVRIIATPIACLEGTGSKLERIQFGDGTQIARSALFFTPAQHQRSHLPGQLGCEFCEDEACIRCGENAATCVPGVYAAGNASRGVQLVIAAAAEGTQAAFSINTALLEADTARGNVLETAL